MGTGTDISQLRTRVSSLANEEALLLQQALDLKRAGGDRHDVDVLMNRAQAIQVERTGVKQEITRLLGTKRMHSGDEVWQPGMYEYHHGVGSGPVRVQVTRGRKGLEVTQAGESDAVHIGALHGFFEGPLSGD